MKLIEQILTGIYWSLLAIIIFFGLKLLWKLSFSIYFYLGKFKIGDVVVSLTTKNSYRHEGDLFTVLPQSSKYSLYYLKTTNNGQAKEWRIATKEEKEAYERGIKNIKDIVYKKVFKKGEYIIILDKNVSINQYPQNFIFKQRIDSCTLESELDVRGSKTNGWIRYRKTDDSGIWRYATKEEGEEYERRGKPFDVTELNKSSFIVGKWYQFDCYNRTYIGKFSEEASNITSVDWIVSGQKQTLRGIWSKSGLSNIKMLDVSIPEIQDALEDGHLDKINSKFGCIPGEIYRVDWTKSSGDVVTIIFKPLTNDGHKGEVYFLNTDCNVFKKGERGVCTAPGINIKFSNASLEEKQWLERCIKKNKWVPMKQELIKGEIYKCKGEEGSIFMFDQGNSASHYIGDNLTSYGKGGGNFYDDPEDYELANAEERTWLLACIKADRFIEKEKALNTEVEKRYEYHAVYTKTEKEWDFVLKYYQSTIIHPRFSTYKNICYVFKNDNKKSDSSGSLEFIKKYNSKIYSFDEWKKEMGIGSLNITTSGTFTIEDRSISTSKYTAILDEFVQIGRTYPPSIEWVEYKYSDKSVYTKKQGVEHQEPIIKKKINKQKSILVL